MIQSNESILSQPLMKRDRIGQSSISRKGRVPKIDDDVAWSGFSSSPKHSTHSRIVSRSTICTMQQHWVRGCSLSKTSGNCRMKVVELAEAAAAPYPRPYGHPGRRPLRRKTEDGGRHATEENCRALLWCQRTLIEGFGLRALSGGRG